MKNKKNFGIPEIRAIFKRLFKMFSKMIKPRFNISASELKKWAEEFVNYFSVCEIFRLLLERR